VNPSQRSDNLSGVTPIRRRNLNPPVWPRNSGVTSCHRSYTKSSDHFTEKSFDRKFLTERPFDRNSIWPNNVWPNAIWPKVHLTESPFYRMPFDRKFILPKKVISPKTKFIKKSFDRKYLENGHLTENLTWKTSQMTEMTYDRKFIYESFFRKMVICSKGHLTKSSYDRKLFPKNGHLTESSFDQKFIWPIIFFEKWSFDGQSFWQKVKQPWFIIRIGKAFLIFSVKWSRTHQTTGVTSRRMIYIVPLEWP
jgi:hypothetical protein